MMLINLSITQNRTLKYFEDLAYMVGISKSLYEEHVLDYLEARYPSLLGWLLHQLEHVNTNDENEKVKILETVKPIVELAKDFDTSIFSQDKQELIHYIIHNNIPEVFKRMNKIENLVEIK